MTIIHKSVKLTLLDVSDSFPFHLKLLNNAKYECLLMCLYMNIWQEALFKLHGNVC